MRRLVLCFALIGGVLAVAVGALVAVELATATPERHTFMHVGCKHGTHAHGRPWHADHGKSVDYKPPIRGSGF